jgi:hypothetical protein
MGTRPSASTVSSSYESKFFFTSSSHLTKPSQFHQNFRFSRLDLDNFPTNRGIQGIGLAGTHSRLYTPYIFSVDGKDTRKEFT